MWPVSDDALPPGSARLQPGLGDHRLPARLEPGAPGIARLQPGSSATSGMYQRGSGDYQPPATLERGAPGNEPPARLEPGDPGNDGIHGWHSRGYLPHFDGRDCIQHVTFHLSDSLPATAVARLEAELQTLPDDLQSVERRKRLHAWIDAGHGRCGLRNQESAEMMQGVLWHGDGLRYRLLAWVIMPNHVHALIAPMPEWSLSKIVASWKSYSGRRLAAAGADMLTGHVWHREYWDRYIRNEAHFLDTVGYIHENPVAAGLSRTALDWPWSSAFAREAFPGTATLQRGSGDFRQPARLEPGAPGIAS